MIDKVLIAEDHESINISVQKTLDDLAITNAHYVYYCDDALMKLEKSLMANDPFDLLITDLYFDEDHRVQRLKNGIELITAARHIQPSLKVLVFSAEHKLAIIQDLINKYEIDGYVRKARHDAMQLKLAVEAVAANKKYMSYLSPDLATPTHAHQFSDVDMKIILLLAQGVLQKNIPEALKRSNTADIGLSSVEKRLKQMKETLNFSKNEQLIAFCKDMGII